MTKKPKAIVYVDGLNLYRRSLENSPHLKWLNIFALSERLLPNYQVLLVRYFTAHIKPGVSLDVGAPVRQQTYLRALRTLAPSISIHLGKFRLDTRRMPVHPLSVDPESGTFVTTTVRKAEEKGSDVNLASRMVADAFLGRADLFVALTNDSDQVGPLKMMREELGFRVGIIFPIPSERSTKELARIPPDVKAHVTVADLEACQFPDNMTDGVGSFFRPPSWSLNSEGPRHESEAF